MKYLLMAMIFIAGCAEERSYGPTKEQRVQIITKLYDAYFWAQ